MTTVAIAPLYLSRLVLDPHSRQVWSELAQPYEMHRTLMRAFSKSPTRIGGKAREQFGVLFRADVDDRRNRVIVYVQSSVEPDWSLLGTLRDYLLANAEELNPACKEVTATYQQLRDGQVLSFCLLANPTKRIGTAAKGESELKGKRVGLLRAEEQIAWLVRKGEEREKGKPGGFELIMNEVEDPNGEIRRVPRVNLHREGKLRGRKREDGYSHETTHLAVRFEGLLRITDANAFRETLARGIGSAKAYGFGLLSIAPMRP